MSEADPRPDEGIAGQRARLQTLESCEEAIRTVRARESELEVEHMAAEAALRGATARHDPGIDRNLAARIGLALERRDALEIEARTARDRGTVRGADRLDALRAARAALEAWLDASEAGKPGGTALAAKITLLIATVITVWAAIAIHPAFLVLILIVIGPVSFALGRGQDREWRRAGARRRFESSGVAGVREWDEATVRARLEELDQLLAAAAADRPRASAPHGPPPEGDPAARIADLEAALAPDLGAAGLTVDDTRGETGSWLRLVARADQARRSLDGVKGERSRLKSEAVELRAQLQGYLHTHGVRPTELPETAAEIAERLDRLARES